MKFDTNGVYNIVYTAEDGCGNKTLAEREVIVETYRTVLYNDGLLIINEKGSDQAANESAHGGVMNTYAAFKPKGTTNAELYKFSANLNPPWYAQRASVTSVKIGSKIRPPKLSKWFQYLPNCVSADLANLDASLSEDMTYVFASSGFVTLDLSNFVTSSATAMLAMFFSCPNLISADLAGFDTSRVTNMNNMFEACTALTQLDLSSFATASGVRTAYMFQDCSSLTTIYASESFDASKIGGKFFMFDGCTSLVGGAGTVYDSSHEDYTYARIDNPPDAPGYFTAKA